MLNNFFFRHDLLSVSYISSSASWGGYGSCARAVDFSDWVASALPAAPLKSRGEL